MNCQQVQDALGDHSVGLLDTNTSTAFSVHISDCGHCAEELRRFYRVIALLDHMPRQGPPPDLWIGIRARIDLDHAIQSYSAAPPRPPSSAYGWLTGIATAALGFATVMGILTLANHPPMESVTVSPTVAAVAERTAPDRANVAADDVVVPLMEGRRLDPRGSSAPRTTFVVVESGIGDGQP